MSNDDLVGRIEELERERVPLSRRVWLTRGAALGAVLGGAALARPAGAANGDPITIGQANVGTGATSLTTTPGGNQTTFTVDNQHATLGTAIYGDAAGVGVAGRGGDIGVSGSSTGGTGVSGSSTGGTGVSGSSTGGTGVYGSSTGGVAISGQSTGGIGVLGNTTGGVAVQGTTVAGVGGWFHSGLVDMRLGDGARSDPTGTGTSVVGDIVAQAASGSGTLWYCAISGTPGSWRRLAGSSTVGALTLLDAPVRVYDSRPNQVPLAVGSKTPLELDIDRAVDCTANSSTVPISALGVLVNLTATNQTGVGWLSARATGSVYGNTSNINWSAAGQTIAGLCAVKCGATASITVRLGGAGTSNVVVDVVGYFR